MYMCKYMCMCKYKCIASSLSAESVFYSSLVPMCPSPLNASQGY